MIKSDIFNLVKIPDLVKSLAHKSFFPFHKNRCDHCRHLKRPTCDYCTNGIWPGWDIKVFNFDTCDKLELESKYGKDVINDFYTNRNVFIVEFYFWHITDEIATRQKEGVYAIPEPKKNTYNFTSDLSSFVDL